MQQFKPQHRWSAATATGLSPSALFRRHNSSCRNPLHSTARRHEAASTCTRRMAWWQTKFIVQLRRERVILDMNGMPVMAGMSDVVEDAVSEEDGEWEDDWDQITQQQQPYQEVDGHVDFNNDRDGESVVPGLQDIESEELKRTTILCWSLESRHWATLAACKADALQLYLAVFTQGPIFRYRVPI